MKDLNIQLRDIARELARRFSTMSHDELAVLESILEPMKFLKGEDILSSGDCSKYIYYVHQGLVRQYYIKNDKEVTNFLGVEGSVAMSIESLFREIPSHETIEALEPCYIYALSKKRLEEVALHNQNIQILYRKILEEALIDTQIQADILRFETAQARYQRFCRHMPKIVLRAPLVYIASYLQMTPETLSRVRSSTLFNR